MENIFSTKHIIGLLWVSIFILVTLFIMLKGKKEKVMKVSAVILILLELTKYSYAIFFDGGFPLIYIPLHFCSLFLYTFPIIAFANEKIANFFKPVSFGGAIVAMLLALLLPTNILGNPDVSWLSLENFVYTLSFVYHGFILATALFIRISGFYKPRKGDLIKSVLVITIFAVIAIIVNNIMDMDFMMLRYGNGNPLQFILNSYGFIPYFITHVLLMFILLSPFYIIKKK